MGDFVDDKLKELAAGIERVSGDLNAAGVSTRKLGQHTLAETKQVNVLDQKAQELFALMRDGKVPGFEGVRADDLPVIFATAAGMAFANMLPEKQSPEVVLKNGLDLLGMMITTSTMKALARRAMREH